MADKAEKEEKKEEKLKEKLEKQELLKKEEEEMEGTMKKKTGKTKYRKTKGEIDKMQARYLKELQKQVKQQEKEKKGIIDEIPVNLNHLRRDEMLKAQEEGKEYASATGIDAALDITGADEEFDKHPEKRRKAVSRYSLNYYRHSWHIWKRIYLESKKKPQG